MRQRGIEFVVGIFIILGFIAFAILAIKISGLSTFSNADDYYVTAKFTNVGDLKVRAPVTMAGVKIGRVKSILLDPVTYKAVVTLGLSDHSNRVPADSTANIYTAGLIGANYISIAPGFDETYLKNGDEIENTTQALILQNIIGQFMYNFKKDKK